MKVSGLSITIGLAILAISVAAVVSCFRFMATDHEEGNSETSGLFDKSKDKLVLPANYETLSAAEKEDILFQQIQSTAFKSLPKLESVNPIKFISAHLMLKLDNQSDEAPVGYEKSIHAHGAAARVRFDAEPNSPYSGLFKGVEHGIIRLSVTADPKGKDFAPGVALKLLVDGHHSENVSALYKLSGQKDNHNFFANELSNIIPIQLDPKSIFSSVVFGRVTSNPTKISVKPFAAINQRGEEVKEPSAPVQIYLVPNRANTFATEVHDFRDDLLKIPSGTTLYDVYATREEGSNLSKIDEVRRSKATKIGRLVSNSSFIASDFGDRRLFFSHYKFEENN